ncbi:MAG: type II secretion system protein [Fimbriimonadaceae bacterium]
MSKVALITSAAVLSAGVSRQAYRRGITLVELLVTILIVMVLVGLVAAGVHYARSSALKSGSISNLRQIYVAVRTYSDAHDGMHPYFVSKKLGPETMQLYKLQLKPYAKSDDIYFCPRDPKARKEHMGAFTNHRDSSYELTGFNMFAMLFDPGTGAYAVPFAKLPNQVYEGYMGSVQQKEQGPDRLPQSIHGFDFAMLMLDGSAQWVDIRRESAKWED